MQQSELFRDEPQRRFVITGSSELDYLFSPRQLADKLYYQLTHLLDYRELVYNFVIRDLKIRYKDSALGFLWSLMNPLMMMMVFTVVFTVLTPIGEIDKFPVFLLCGLLPWNFFSSSVMGCAVSVVGSGSLLKKIYFPREALPISTILSNLVHFLLAMIVLFVFMAVFNVPLTIWALYLPVIILIQMIFTLGVGMFLATTNVFYRDTMQIVDVLMLAWFFFTPVFYPIKVLPKSYEIFGITLDVHWLMYVINPMASLVASYRTILYDGAPPALDFLFRTTVTAVVVCLLGWLVFQRYRWRFAEEL